MLALCEGRDGSLWIGTYGGGLSRFKDGTFTTYTTANGLPDDTVRALSGGSRRRALDRHQRCGG